jgi:energy-coupling factor transport system ATP-binding protein
MRIDHILHKNPLELSGGQVQRLALGSSIIMEPDIIVLDECTSQLDPLGSEEIFDIIQDLNESGKTIIIVDHDMERVARTADRIMVLHKGRQIALDTPENIFGNPVMREHGIGVPDFTRIGLSLRIQHLYHGGTILTEKEAIDATKKVVFS